MGILEGWKAIVIAASSGAGYGAALSAVTGFTGYSMAKAGV